MLTPSEKNFIETMIAEAIAGTATPDAVRDSLDALDLLLAGQGAPGDRDDDDCWSDDDGLSDVEADAMTLASAGWGTDEDYGCFGGEDY